MSEHPEHPRADQRNGSSNPRQQTESKHGGAANQAEDTKPQRLQSTHPLQAGPCPALIVRRHPESARRARSRQAQAHPQSPSGDSRASTRHHTFLSQCARCPPQSGAGASLVSCTPRSNMRARSSREPRPSSSTVKHSNPPSRRIVHPARASAPTWRRCRSGCPAARTGPALSPSERQILGVGRQLEMKLARRVSAPWCSSKAPSGFRTGVARPVARTVRGSAMHAPGGNQPGGVRWPPCSPTRRASAAFLSRGVGQHRERGVRWRAPGCLPARAPAAPWPRSQPAHD